MKTLQNVIFIVIATISLSACSVPGWGFYYASDFIQTERVGLRVVDVEFDNSRTSGSLTLKIRNLSFKERFYSSEKIDHSWRYFIIFRTSDDCRYSIIVDHNGIIKSWRDEGGKTHMNRCYVG